MKTQIKLADYKFSGKNNMLFQISDDPINKLARVIELDRVELLFDVDSIPIKGTTHYINAVLKVVVFKEETLVDGTAWNVVKGDFTVKLDEKINPVLNPDFNKELPISVENYPYVLIDAYEQFKGILIQLNGEILAKFVDLNDQKGLYNKN
jgi:hypothetical protein